MITVFPCEVFSVDNSQQPEYSGFTWDTVTVLCSAGFAVKGMSSAITQFDNHCNGSTLWDNMQECSREY